MQINSSTKPTYTILFISLFWFIYVQLLYQFELNRIIAHSVIQLRILTCQSQYKYIVQVLWRIARP